MALESAVGPRYSPSTLSKHEWVTSMYKCFILRFNLEPFPLDTKLVAFFIRFLGTVAKYAVSTIEDVIAPSLKRLHREFTDTPCSEDINESIALAIRDVKRSPSQLKGPDGKAPATLSDVKIIIEKTPEGVPTKAAESSLWLFALTTGARAITCFNVQVCDIINVISKAGSGNVLIQILLRVTKGNQNWGHTVTVEGDPKKKSNLNIAFWLNEHLKQRFGLQLESFHMWPEQPNFANIWSWSKDSMRQLFKTRADFAGFPYTKFSFHSLRAGFICTAIMNAGISNDAIKAVLEHTAYVAGWVPGQTAQMRYVKDCVKRSIVSSRLVLSAEELESDGIVDKVLTTSENFHNIKLGPSKWQSDTNYKMFQYLVEKAFTKEDLPEREKNSLCQKCWRNAFNRFVLSNVELGLG